MVSFSYGGLGEFFWWRSFRISDPAWMAAGRGAQGACGVWRRGRDAVDSDDFYAEPVRDCLAVRTGHFFVCVFFDDCECVADRFIQERFGGYGERLERNGS